MKIPTGCCLPLQLPSQEILFPFAWQTIFPHRLNTCSVTFLKVEGRLTVKRSFFPSLFGVNALGMKTSLQPPMGIFSDKTILVSVVQPAVLEIRKLYMPPRRLLK